MKVIGLEFCRPYPQQGRDSCEIDPWRALEASRARRANRRAGLTARRFGYRTLAPEPLIWTQLCGAPVRKASRGPFLRLGGDI